MTACTIAVYEKQAAFLDSKAPFRGFVGGIGSGKSWVGAYDIVCRAQPGRLYMAVAPTYRMLADSSLRSFLDVARDNLDVLDGDLHKGNMSAFLKNGAEIIFRSADDPEKLRGPNLSGMWLDEASLMAEAAFTVSIGRLRQGGEMGWLTATFTPKGKQHWTYDVFGPDPHTGKPRKDTELFHARTDENPFLPPNFHDIIRGKYLPALADQELGGEFMDPAGALMKSAWFRPRYTRQGDYYRLHHPERGTVSIDSKTCLRFATMDCASSIKTTADFTVVCVWDFHRPTKSLILVDVYRDKIESPRVVPTLTASRIRWGWVYVAVEIDGVGLPIYQGIRAAGIPSRGMSSEQKDKAVRSIPFQVLAEQGHVYLPQPSPVFAWLAPYEAEILSFPGGNYDDQVDCSSSAGIIVNAMTMQSATAKPSFGEGMQAV